MCICIKHCTLHPPTIVVNSLGNIWDSWGLGLEEYEVHTMNLLHLRQFSTWVYHTHVSALVHPLVHSLLYWSHLMQAWWQHREKNVFDIASFLTLFNDDAWIVQCSISLSVDCFRMQKGALDPAALNNWAEALIGHILHVSLFLIISIFAERLGAMHGAHSGGFNGQSWDFVFVCDSILIFVCWLFWLVHVAHWDSGGFNRLRRHQSGSGWLQVRARPSGHRRASDRIGR